MADERLRELERRLKAGDRTALTAIRAHDRRTQDKLPQELWDKVEARFYGDAEFIHAFDSMPDLATEAGAHPKRRTYNTKLADRVEPERVVYAKRGEMDKAKLWAYALKRSRTFGVKKEETYTGWRKCHTENYWAYFAYDLSNVIRCPRCKGSGGDVVDCSLCDGRGAVDADACAHHNTERVGVAEIVCFDCNRIASVRALALNLPDPWKPIHSLGTSDA